MKNKKKKNVDQRQQEGLLWISGIMALILTASFAYENATKYTWWETLVYSLGIAVISFIIIFISLSMALRRRYKDRAMKIEKEYPEYYNNNVPEKK